LTLFERWAGGVLRGYGRAHGDPLIRACITKKNERDLENIPEKLREDLEFVLVEKVNEVVAVAMHPPKSVVKHRPTRQQPPLPTIPPSGTPPS
jgi:ATP-dependent Lon protease